MTYFQMTYKELVLRDCDKLWQSCKTLLMMIDRQKEKYCKIAALSEGQL